MTHYTSTKLIHAAIDQGARLNRELGQGSGAEMPVRKIIIHTNVNLFALRKAATRAAIETSATPE